MSNAPQHPGAEVHDRMPVILPPEAWPAWLSEEPTEPAQLKAMLAPYPADRMTCWPVSARRQRRNNDPTLIDPIELTTA